jgi:hypothetical protein
MRTNRIEQEIENASDSALERIATMTADALARAAVEEGDMTFDYNAVYSEHLYALKLERQRR